MVDAPPDITYFKPRGVPLSDLNEIYLSIEGYEALRLADYHNMTHDEASGRMQVSRQTFGRILAQARQTVARALVVGLSLRIHGGNYAVSGKSDGHAQGDTDASVEQTKEPEPKEITMAKIAITSEGPQLDDQLDPRFGRAAGFIVVDPETLEFEYVDNGASQAMAQGAGIQAAENIAKTGAKAVLTGFVGPKAFMALDAVGVRVGQNLENMTVRQAIERYIKGDVEWADQANRQGHGR
jgi:predicted DNA-binding protein (UPF0251 family)/predicted Fe-Mo cluster-binding NifX family protein